jgi:hypothetical protein
MRGGIWLAGAGGLSGPGNKTFGGSILFPNSSAGGGSAVWVGNSGGNAYFNVPTGLNGNLTIGNSGILTWNASGIFVNGTLSINSQVSVTSEGSNVLSQRNGTSPQTFNLYSSYTDGSNLSRLVCQATDALGTFVIGTQKLGTGTSSTLYVGTGTPATGVAGYGGLTLAGATIQITTQFGNVFNVNASGVVSWTAGTTLKTPASTVAALPAVAGAQDARAIATDSTVVAAGNFGNAVVGGGGNRVPVYSDGVTWRIG